MTRAVAHRAAGVLFSTAESSPHVENQWETTTHTPRGLLIGDLSCLHSAPPCLPVRSLVRHGKASRFVLCSDVGHVVESACKICCYPPRWKGQDPTRWFGAARSLSARQVTGSVAGHGVLKVATKAVFR